MALFLYCYTVNVLDFQFSLLFTFLRLKYELLLLSSGLVACETIKELKAYVVSKLKKLHKKIIRKEVVPSIEPGTWLK